MDGKFKSVVSDSTGNFAYPYIEYRREVITHNFTIPIVVQGQHTSTCHITYNIPASNPFVRIDMRPPFDLGTICPKNINLHLSSSTATTSNPYYFRPGDTAGSKQYAAIDLRYDVTVVRKPTTNSSNDGLWNIVLYLRGYDLNNVSKVKYYLSSTFKPNVIMLNQLPDNPTFSLPLSAHLKQNWRDFNSIFRTSTLVAFSFV